MYELVFERVSDLPFVLALREILRHPDVKLVLMDVLMAELAGLELLQRGREYTLSTMWITLSAVDTFDFRQQGRSRTLAVRRRHLLAPA